MEKDSKENTAPEVTEVLLIRRSELTSAMKNGGFGKILIPVRILDAGGDVVRLQKDGNAEVQGEFTDSEPLDSMKRRLGTAEER